MIEITLSINLKNQLTLGRKNEFSVTINSEHYQGEFETEEGGGMLFTLYREFKPILYSKRIRLPLMKTFFMQRLYDVFYLDQKLCQVKWSIGKRRLIIGDSEYKLPSLKNPVVPALKIAFPRSHFLKPMTGKLTVNVEAEDKNSIWIGVAITCIVGLRRCFIASD